MIKFSYSEGTNWFAWQTSWDGNHDDSWYKKEETVNFIFNSDDVFEIKEEGGLRIIGGMCPKNPATISIIQMLSSLDTLHEWSGYGTAIDLFGALVRCLDNLWD